MGRVVVVVVVSPLVWRNAQTKIENTVSVCFDS